jgi:hypothetical protein
MLSMLTQPMSGALPALCPRANFSPSVVQTWGSTLIRTSGLARS